MLAEQLGLGFGIDHRDVDEGHRWQKSGLTGEGLNTVVVPRLRRTGTAPRFIEEKLPCWQNIASDGIRHMRNHFIQLNVSWPPL